MSNANASLAQPPASRKVSRYFGQYIIKHRFQFKISTIVLFIMALVSFLLWLEAKITLTALMQSGVIKEQEAILQLGLVSGILGKTAVLINAFAFGALLVLSHFIAGPLYRIERTFEELQKGNLGTIIRLRKNDELQDFAHSLNGSLSGLREKFRKEREALDEVIKEAGQLAEALRLAGRDDEAVRLNQLVARLKNDARIVKLS